ncbi:ScyD/ScyE family protein [Deinococcus aluminii]|uniref:ScyD/ScyE family protein n=1 Tax=Deinococcus aluminii TaxID=1656885 RepID=A0ABP9XE04_9DEIO
MHLLRTRPNLLPRGTGLLALTALLSGCSLLSPPVSHQGTVVAQGLNSPQGVYVGSDGTVWIADSGTGGPGTFTTPPDPGSTEPTTVHYGNTARIVRVDPGGTSATVVTLPSLAGAEEAEGASRVAELGGKLYVTSGAWSAGASIAQLPNTAALLRLDGSSVTRVANTWTYEEANDPDKQGGDSHAYGLAAGPDGNLWITDAAANDLLRANPATGALTLVTVFDNLPVANPGPGMPPSAQPVPTGVAFLNDGAAYVSLLPGFPFTPGSSKVVRVASDGSKTDYATGLSMTTDLKAGPDGNLYAAELGQFGEQGPVAGTGSIVRIRAGGIKETVLAGLNTPTSLAFNRRGDAFITVGGAAAPGTGQVLRWDALTSKAALPSSP